TRRPPRPTLFPYTTLFRSGRDRRDARVGIPFLRDGDSAISIACCPSPYAWHGQQQQLPGCCTTERPQRITCSDYFRPQGRSRRRSEEHTSELQSRENLVCR